MNEIKFKIWIPYAKIMMVPKSIQTIHEETINGVTIGQMEQWVYRLCTGLEDKNKVDIYAGDIVQYMGERFQIAWIEQAMMFTALPTDHTGREHFLNGNYLDRCEIIGNIYQHPELLN